jgi:hypothetical protein
MFNDVPARDEQSLAIRVDVSSTVVEPTQNCRISATAALALSVWTTALAVAPKSVLVPLA